MSLRRLSIRNRLVGAFAIVIVFMLGIGTVALLSTRTINGYLIQVQSNDLPSVAKAGEISGWMARYAISVYRHTGVIDPDSKKRVDGEVEERRLKTERVIADYGPLVSSPEERALYDTITATWDAYQAEIKTILGLSRSGMNEDAFERLQGKAAQLQRSAIDTANALVQLNNRHAAASRSASEQAFERMLAIVVGAATTGLILSILLATIIIRGISGSIGSVVRPMTALARGDLAVAIPHQGSGTEIGRIADAVQVFKDGLLRMKALEEETVLARAGAEAQRRQAMRDMADGFERAVGGIVGSVGSAATELQATAQAMTATASQTASQSVSVAAAAEEAASNVETVAAAAEELGSSVQEIGRQVQGSASLAEAAVAEAGATAVLVQELSGATSRIGDVVKLISDIAGQTNLLALNATIEAARAGEAGRGFAVVAAEVKQLANQTARATDEIGTQIARIQGATGQSVRAIEAIRGRIGEISTVATSIAAAVEEQGAATQEIVRNVSQAAAGTGEVTQNIAGVAGAAEETGAAAAQVLASASELSRQSEHLGAEVGRFLATVRAA
ncbi:methyl-accepting chemotaxis protein [Methylobacterium sp. BTF04]|uniref:methyl-accepting chemotaxis protein n=1 Tax=Methylobacterium sp. BTF04 TaxID=2708300 RepID=UPI0013D0B995|nr:methyl-accepting chemotaxis protein [Methylobacterium sp. BTF04]NEU12592.1 methyl-accepting chemotaxis protein [Methylobacterium sp. BTF04]